MATQDRGEIASNFADFTECPICMCKITSATITTCGHRYCEACIHRWVSAHKRCPHCNEALTTAQLIKDRQYDSLIDMIEAQGAVGGAMPHVSQGGGTNSQVTVTQSISPGPSMGPGSAGNQGMLNQQNPNRNNVMQNVTTNIGTSGMDPRRGQPGQINPPPMVGTGSGEPAPGMTGTLPGVGADCMVNRTVVWRGQPEWQNKKSMGPMQGTSSKITRNLSCVVSIRQSDPEMQSSNWPRTLIMQLMPQMLLNTPQLVPLLRNSRQVTFHFPKNQQSLDHMRNLHKVMHSAFAGCVHLTPRATPPCDIRVLLLLFSNRRKQFVGLIPNDQNGVVIAIRQVITQHKQRMMAMSQVNGTMGSPQS